MDYRFAPGSSFAGYTIDAPIGSGCAGETYRARRAGTRINVALKIAWPELAAAPGFAFEMQRQAKILQRFRHPRLCAVLDSGISKGLPFWASEYVPGPNDAPYSLKDYLKDRTERGRMIEEEEVFIIAQEIIETISALHNFRDREECPDGIALGDLRPANIMLDADTKFRLCDLGISALVRATTHAFSDSKGIGVGYMSPEVRRGEPPTPRSDVYSIGAIIYELLTGQKFSASAPPPSQARKGIKTGWDGLLLNRCLAENPDDRIADMASLKKVIENLEQTKRAKTIVLNKKAETQEVLPIADEGNVPADLASQSTIAKPKSIVLRKKGAAAGTSKPAVPIEIAQAETIAFAKPQPRRSEPAHPAPKPKSRAGLWIGLGVAILACAGFVGGYYAMNHGKGTAVASNTVATAAAPAKPQPKITEGQHFKLTSAPVEMKWIPAASNALLGTELADQKALEPGLPPSEVHVLGYEKPESATIASGFWMAETEVTLAHWKMFAAANPTFKTTAEKKGEAATVLTNGTLDEVKGVSWRNPVPGATPPDDHPVTCITPADMQTFCAWLTNHERDAGRISPEYFFRLPTDIEWEYACRGGATARTRFWWGSDEASGAGRLNGAGAEYTKKFPATQKYNFTWDDQHLHTAPAGSFGEKGRNAFGLSDMLGNVWECATHGPQNKREFTWRGGSFAEGHTIVRCASTRHRYTDQPAANAGFRVVLSK